MKRSLQGKFLILLFTAAIALFAGCSKSIDTTPPIPTVTTQPILSNLTATAVISGGKLESTTVVTENGVCYSSTNKTPTISDTFTADTVAGRWTSVITGLTPNTTYYLRAYASSDGGTGYGDVVTFTTGATNAVPTGTVTTFVGSAAGENGFVEGIGTAALLDGPQSITYNASKNVFYVGDSFNNAIRLVTIDGTTSTPYNNTLGYTNGSLADARFYGPKGFSFDTQGNTYVADIGNNVIRKITADGTVSTLAGTSDPGYLDGIATVAKFYNPTSTAVDAAGNVYVSDRSNNLIRKITPAGVVSVHTGFRALNGYAQSSVPGYLDGDAATALFSYPLGITIDATGNIYVADYKNNAIRKVTPVGDVTTYAGGRGFPALLGNPTDVVLDAKGNMFIADANGRILEITSAKVLYVLAGAVNTSGYVNGVGAAARFSGPQSLTLDGQGNLYVADLNNNAIRKITVAVQ